MANVQTPLLQELARVADSHDIRDQLPMLFRREVVEDSEKMEEYDMRLNIISTGLLDEDGYHNNFGNGLWKVTLGSLIVASGKDKRESKLQRHGNSASKDSRMDTLLNGLAERMNRTLVERVRCLLSHARVLEERQRYIENAKRETIPQHNDDLIDLDSVPLKHFDSQFGDDIQNDEEQGADDVDAQEQPNLDEDVHPELPVPDMPPFLMFRQHECYAEAYERLNIKKRWFDAWKMNEFLATEEHTSRLRYKARLVVKGFSQKRGIDFDEISPVVKMGSIRVVLGLAASLDLEVEQMDVKTDFLHGDLDKEIYMEQHEGFQVKGKEGYKFGDDDFIILLLYVDDILTVGKKFGRIAQLKRDLSKFNMDKAKVVSSPLTTNFKLTDKDCPSSKKNIEKMDRVPYASAVGSLMYAMVCTRPDLAHAVGVGEAVSWNLDAKVCGIVYNRG
ncbi:putative RNA-directed DNA polymerase [Tanacetum coccineum]|uniref:RNA-directed DNA polymerase n=1 Tax=Tanacetum coccineum TaxID=301880 RepID=A0ABQ5HGG2_9ASTR